MWYDDSSYTSVADWPEGMCTRTPPPSADDDFTTHDSTTQGQSEVCTGTPPSPLPYPHAANLTPPLDCSFPDAYYTSPHSSCSPSSSSGCSSQHSMQQPPYPAFHQLTPPPDYSFPGAYYALPHSSSSPCSCIGCSSPHSMQQQPPYPSQYGFVTTHHSTPPMDSYSTHSQSPDSYWSPPNSVCSPCSSSDCCSSQSPEQLVQPQQEQLQAVQQSKDQNRKRPRRRVDDEWDGRLTVNPELQTHYNDMKTLWFFVLELLVDVNQKAIVVWTGRRREFKIIDSEALRKIWGDYNRRPNVKWSSMTRVFRGLADTVFLPVPTTNHKGRNVAGLYQFITEPSYHLNWTESALDDYIEQHAEPSYASSSDSWIRPKRRRMSSPTTAPQQLQQPSPPLSQYQTAAPSFPQQWQRSPPPCYVQQPLQYPTQYPTPPTGFETLAFH